MILSSFEGAQKISDNYVHPSTTVKLSSQVTEYIYKSLRALQMTNQSHRRK